MTNAIRSHHERGRLTSYFWSDDVIRSRSVSEVVLSDTLHVPAPPTRLIADWGRDISQRLGLELGDVDELSLARARARWPEFRHCVKAVADWMHPRGLPEVLLSSDIALMACRRGQGSPLR